MYTFGGNTTARDFNDMVRADNPAYTNCQSVMSPMRSGQIECA